MNEYRLEGIKEGPAMTGSDLMFAAEVAFAGGIFEEMPTTPDEVIDAFESIGIDIVAAS